MKLIPLEDKIRNDLRNESHYRDPSALSGIWDVYKDRELQMTDERVQLFENGNLLVGFQSYVPDEYVFGHDTIILEGSKRKVVRR